jgi:hypothetical protein
MVAYNIHDNGDNDDNDFQPVARAMAVPQVDMLMRDWIQRQIEFNNFYEQERENAKLPKLEDIPEDMTMEEYRQWERNNSNNN